MIAGIAFCCVGAMALGMPSSGPRPRVLKAALFLVGVVIVCGFGFAFALPEAAPQDPATLLGFPLRTALVVYVVGVIPLVLLPIAYALAFDERLVSPELLERLRALGHREDV